MSASFAWVSGLALLAAPADVTTIRDAPGGKRLLVIDGDDVRDDVGGKRLLFIDGSDIRDAPGGKRLLFVDGDDVRPAPGGIRLAILDGQDVRRKPKSARLLFIDGDDIRDAPGGKRLLFIDGPKLSKPQLVAALFHLKPELFKLSAEEEKGLKDAMAEAAAETDKAFDTALFGNLSVINSNVKPWNNGKITTTPGKDGFAYVDFQLDGGKMVGIALRRDVRGFEGLWLAASPKGKVALAVYEINGGKLDGQWIPINAAKDGKETLGHEKLEGPPSLEGKFKIIEAKGPNGGAEYTGSLTLKKANPADAHQVFFGEDFRVATWTLGKAKASGIGYINHVHKDGKKKSYLVLASGTEKGVVVGALLKESATSVKDFELVHDSGKAGYINVSKAP